MMQNFCARKSPAKVAERSELEPWHSEAEERPWFVQRTGALLVASASSPSLDALQASAIGCCQETQEVLEPSLHLLRPPTIWRHCRMQKKRSLPALLELLLKERRDLIPLLHFWVGFLKKKKKKRCLNSKPHLSVKYLRNPLLGASEGQKTKQPTPQKL